MIRFLVLGRGNELVCPAEIRGSLQQFIYLDVVIVIFGGKAIKLYMLNALVEIARCGSLNFFFNFSALLIFKFFNRNLNSDLLDHCHFQKILH